MAKTPDVSVEAEPVDPLKEAREDSVKLAEELAVATGDETRAFASALEAQLNKPKPNIKRPLKMTGKIDTKAVKRVFNMHVNAMKKCYERELKRNPGLEGKVKLQVVIKSDGKVGGASVKGVSLRNQKINSCMEREARGMKFPKPTGGAVTVANPYTFTPDI